MPWGSEIASGSPGSPGSSGSAAFGDCPGTILVVDDLQANRQALRKLLEAPNRRVIEAASGFEAVQVLLTTEISLVLLDIEMPEIDGFETAKLIRGSQRINNVPIIFQSAHGTDERALRGYSLGAVDFIQKPIIPAILQARVDVFLALADRTRELTETAVRLHDADARTRSILENATDGVITIDESGRIESFNRAAERMFGYEPSRVIGKNAETLLVDATTDEPALTPAHIQRSMGTTLELVGIRSNTTTFPVGVSVSAAGDHQRQISVVTIRDLTETKHAEDRLMRLAQYDHLTGLANRITLEERVSRSLAHTRRYEGSGALMYLDIDGFKTVNDAYGHRVGDLLLQEASRRLSDATREADVIARLGGDEFCVLLDHLADPGDAEIVAERIVAAFRNPFDLDGYRLSSFASLGYTTINVDDSIGGIILRADSAMYAAKRAGGNRAVAAHEDADSLAEISKRLSAAIAEKAFEFTFEPIRSVATGQEIAVDARFHWRQSAAELVPLDSIRRAAEASGLIQRIARLAVGECMAYLARDSDGGSIHLNLSLGELSNPEILEQIAQQTDELGVDPRRFVACVNGDALQYDPAVATHAIAALKATGARVFLDEFGRAHSSVNTLLNHSLDGVKINNWLVRSRGGQTNDVTILKAITEIAHTSGLEVVATGVDSVEAFDAILEAKCDFVQGSLCATTNGDGQLIPSQPNALSSDQRKSVPTNHGE